MPDHPTPGRGSARRRRSVVVALLLMLSVAAAVVGAAAVLTAAQTPMWTARTEVVVDIEETGVLRAPAMGTEREIASSTVVAQVAARALRADAEEMLRHLRVTVPVETNVLQIEYDAVTAAQAQRGAAAFANAYVDYRSQPDFSGPSAPAPIASVISPADLPQEPSKPSWLMNMTTAALLGAALGVAAGYRRLAAALRLPPEADPGTAPLELLAVVPTRRAGRVESELPHSEQEEQEYQRLRTHVLANAVSAPVPSLLVVGSRNTVCTSAVAWQLAVGLAEGGARTVLVALATDVGSLHRMSGGRTSCGLFGVLRGSRSMRMALLPTEVSGLSVLPPGTGLGTSDLVARHGLREVLRELSRDEEFVVVDGGAVLAAGPGLEVVGDVPTVLLVVGPDTGPGDVEAATADLRRRHGRVLGTVLALPHSRRDRRIAERRVGARFEVPPRQEALVAPPGSGATISAPLNGG